MKELINKLAPNRYICCSACGYIWLAFTNVRRIGFQRLPLCKIALLNIGVFPIRNHYYEPQFDFRETSRLFSHERDLPGIKWNLDYQLEIIKKFNYAAELIDLPKNKTNDLEYYLNNKAFEEGDSEYWYQLIRFMKPKKIFEIGSEIYSYGNKSYKKSRRRL